MTDMFGDSCDEDVWQKEAHELIAKLTDLINKLANECSSQRTMVEEAGYGDDL